MSARKLPRQLGVIISCDKDGCSEQFRSATIRIRDNRCWAQKQLGWLRSKWGGLRRDVCSTCAPAEKKRLADPAKTREERAAKKQAREEQKLARAEKRKARAPKAAEVSG